MESPQKENGNTGIANELLEKLLLFNFPSASPLKIWLFVARKTYGWQKKKDILSLSQIVKATRLSKQTVNESLKWLVNASLLVKGKTTKFGVNYGINKYYSTWVVNPHRLVKDRHFASLGALTHNKYYNNKKNIGDKSPVSKNMESEIYYVEEGNKTPKKYLNRKKLYSRLAVYYMNVSGQTGDALRYFKDIKELVDMAEPLYDDITDSKEKEKGIEAEIKGRIDVAGKWYKNKGLTFSLNTIVKNWNKILNEYRKEV